ncbi:MAG: FAD:protein FMN transferase [Bacilli bacterium]
MHNLINKIIWITVIILIVLGFVLQKNKKNYVETLNYFDTEIYISINDITKNQSQTIISNINEIYSKYEKVCSRTKQIDDIVNLYYINYNTSSNDTIQLNQTLYNMIEYGYNWYQASDGLFDISKGNIYDIWNSYRLSKIGIPSIQELELMNTNSIEEIKLLENNQILNSNQNIYLYNLPLAFATKEVKEYLNKNNVTNYFINAGDIITLGDAYKKENYLIGLEDPTSKTGEIFITLKENNINVISSGGNKSYYEFNNQRFHNIINPSTLYPENNFLSVTVLSEDILLATVLANTLYSMDIDVAKTYLKKYDVQVIWYLNDFKIEYYNYDK